MSCIECIYIKKNRDVCSDISELLFQLKIPIQEQTVIWNMAVKAIGCRRLKNLLSSLMERKSNIDSISRDICGSK